MQATLTLLLILCASLLSAQGIITTIAGGGQFQVTGVGGPATTVPLASINGIATDGQGNLYVADNGDLLVYKIASTGVLSIFAGNGTQGTGGDGGPATSASFNEVAALSADPSGNLFVVAATCTIRKIGVDGRISTFAGNGSCGYSGDGGPATQASFGIPQAIAADPNGNLYIAENNRIRKVTPQGIISTVAGNGQCCYTTGGLPAISTPVPASGLAVDQNGVIYIAQSQTSASQILRVGADGIVLAIAGGNRGGDTGDGGPAIAAELTDPHGLAIDHAGNLYFAETLGQRVREITPDGIIHTVAGTGVANYTGDQGQASLATLDRPVAVAADASGNVFIADSGNSRIRSVNPAGVITTYAGNGGYGFAGDGGQARQAVLHGPTEVLAGASGNVYFSDTGNNRVREIAANGVITTIAGGGAGGFAGDGGPATQALLSRPAGLALDSMGNLYVADTGNLRVRKIDLAGNITTFAGNGTHADSGDGGPAVEASLNDPADIAFDAQGNLYIADTPSDYGAVRKVLPDGTITSLPAVTYGPLGAIAVDAAGNVYASAYASFGRPGGTIFRISPDGATLTAVSSFSGTAGKIAFDPQGNFYMGGTSTVSKVTPSGAQSVVAGTGQAGFAGDDGPAIMAQLNSPQGVALDAAGNLYIADSGNNRIRKIFLNPASGVFEPSLQVSLQPGYYTAAVTLGQGEHPGSWGMQVLAPVGVLAGGFNLGGTVQQSSAPPGFGGVYVPTPQSLHVHVDAQAADAASPGSTVGLSVQLLDPSNNPVGAQQFGGTSLDFTQPLAAGYYTIVVRGGTNSPDETFQMALSAPYFSGGVDVGAFIGPNSTGFGGFDLTAPQQVSIQVYGQPTYGADGAGGLRLTLYDANRNVIATAP